MNARRGRREICTSAEYARELPKRVARRAARHGAWLTGVRRTWFDLIEIRPGRPVRTSQTAGTVGLLDLAVEGLADEK